MRLALPALVALLLSVPGPLETNRVAADPVSPPSPWQVLEPGLEYASFPGPGGDGQIAVVRVDPSRFDLRLLNSSATEEGLPLSARHWAERAGASAAINASMYQEDHSTSVALMHTREHVNQRHLSKDRAVLAFDPLVSGVPPVRIIDLDCERLEQAGAPYGTLVQSIRLVSCDRKNVWAPSTRKFSAAAIGIDGGGRVLFIHTRYAFVIHDLVDQLLALPIDLRQAMYVEGGPEAQLFVHGGGRTLEWTGSLATAPEVALGTEGWPIPNVIVAVRRPSAPAASAPRTSGQGVRERGAASGGGRTVTGP